MAGSGGISGPAVAMATAGAFLVYVGVRNVPILAGLREITNGSLPAARNKPNDATRSALAALFTGSTGTGVVAAADTTGASGGAFPALVGAVQQFAGDHYSQARRWDPGFSDCSSFVGKGLKSLGITPPGISVTGSYLTWGQLRKVDRSQLAAGDLCVNSGHMIVATGNGSAIGQQNSRSNVRTGTPEELMPGSFVCLRYTGAQPATAASMAA